MEESLATAGALAEAAAELARGRRPGRRQHRADPGRRRRRRARRRPPGRARRPAGRQGAPRGRPSRPPGGHRRAGLGGHHLVPLAGRRGSTTAADRARTQPGASAAGRAGRSAALASRNRVGGYAGAVFESVSVHELEEIEDELFRFARTVEANRPLRSAFGDRDLPASERQALAAELLAGKVSAATGRLVAYAIRGGRARDFVWHPRQPGRGGGRGPRLAGGQGARRPSRWPTTSSGQLSEALGPLPASRSSCR